MSTFTARKVIPAPKCETIMIDWLGHVIDWTSNGSSRVGHLLAHDSVRGYVCDVRGDLRSYPPGQVRIQTVKGGPYDPGAWPV